MKLMQFFNALGVFIVPSILFLHFRGVAFYSYLKFNSSVYVKGLLAIIIMALAMIPVANFLGALNAMLPLPDFLSFLKEIEAQTLLITEQFLVMDTPIDLLLMLGLIGFACCSRRGAFISRYPSKFISGVVWFATYCHLVDSFFI